MKKNICTCGTNTSDHSIFCSGDFYIDPLSQGKYRPKNRTEKTCDTCFLVLNESFFEKNQSVCIECKDNK